MFPYIGSTPIFFSQFNYGALTECPLIAVELAADGDIPVLCGSSNCNTLPPPGPPPRPPIPQPPQPPPPLPQPPPAVIAPNPPSCASSCAAMSSTPISCITAVTYSNLPVGVSAPSPGVFTPWFTSTITPPALQACATSKVVCNSAAVAQGICTNLYLGATVTVQYPITSSVCQTSPPFVPGSNSCNQMSSNGATCEYDDLQTEQTCSQGNSGCYDWASPATFGTVLNGAAGEGLYLLYYCNTYFCNGLYPSMDSTAPGSFCQNSQIANAEAAAVAAIAGVLIGAIVGGVLGACCCIGSCVYLCCIRGRERCCGPKRQQGVVVVVSAESQPAYLAPAPVQSPTRSGALIELASKTPPRDVAPSSSPSDLPPHWREERTPKGKIFYYNEKEEMQRKRPVAEDVEAPPPPALTREAAPLPPHWHETATEEGRVYYYNDETERTSWKRPKH